MSAFTGHRRVRLEREVRRLLERGRPAAAARRQEELCRLLEDGDAREHGGHLLALAEIHELAGAGEAASAVYGQARARLEEYLAAEAPELLVSPDTRSSTPGVRHLALDYDLETAQVLNRLGMLHHRLGDVERARPLLERAMAITRRRLGVDHPDFAVLLGNLADVERSAGRFAAAERLLRQASEALAAALGEAHPELAKSLVELASLYRDQGRWHDALVCEERALATLRGAWGDDHPELARVHRRVAVLELRLGDLTAAEWHLLRARRILTDKLPADPGDDALTELPSILEDLAEVYRRMGNDESALRVRRQARDLCRRHGTVPDKSF